jgi:hypothetical protein
MIETSRRTADDQEEQAVRSLLCAPWSYREWGKTGRVAARVLRDVFWPFPKRDELGGLLAWEGGTVARLATAIYQECAFDQIAVLADALEDAGCTDKALLTHLRSPGPHVRGCWALDLVLGKQ